MAAGGAGPADGSSIRHLAEEWLQGGQYERAAAVLGAAQAHSAQAGDSLAAHILEIARQLCLACERCQQEAEWHRQAYEEIASREQELRQQLHAILERIGSPQATSALLKPDLPYGLPGPESDSPEPGRPGPAQRPRLWQRIQAIFRPGPTPPSIEPEATEIPRQEEARPSPDLPERVAPVPPVRSAVQEPEEQPSPTLLVYCLGAFRVFCEEQPITEWNGLKGKSIFKYLLTQRETPVAKDILMDLFWPDATAESARRNLHQAVYSLRQTLRCACPGFSHIQFESDCYFINPEMDIWVDSEEFERHVQAGKRLESAGRALDSVSEYGIAESLYQGDFLEEDLYDDWTMAQRERLRRLYCDVADRLSRYYVQNDEYTAAASLCHRALAQDNCHEPSHRRLMRCYLAQGQRHLAVRQYLTCVEVLQEELELGPSEETEALYRRITEGT